LLLQLRPDFGGAMIHFYLTGDRPRNPGGEVGRGRGRGMGPVLL
jgi:hypothetical protein